MTARHMSATPTTTSMVVPSLAMRWVPGACVGAQLAPAVPSVHRSAPMPDPMSLVARATIARPLLRATVSELITADESSTLLHWTVARPTRARVSAHSAQSCRWAENEDLLVAYVYAPRIVRPGESRSDTLGDDFWATYERLRRIDLGIAAAQDAGAQTHTQSQSQKRAESGAPHPPAFLRASKAVATPVAGQAPPQKASSVQMLQQQRLSGIREEELYETDTDQESDYSAGSVGSLDIVMHYDARSESALNNIQQDSSGGGGSSSSGKPKKSSRLVRALTGFARLARLGRRRPKTASSGSASSTEVKEHQSRKEKHKIMATMSLPPDKGAMARSQSADCTNGSDSPNGRSRRSMRSGGSVVARVGSLESLHSYDSDRNVRGRSPQRATSSLAPQLVVEGPTPEHTPTTRRSNKSQCGSSLDQQVCASLCCV